MFCFLFSKETQRGVNPLKKAFMRDLKLIYRAANKDIAERALDDLEDKWGKKYSIVTTSWRNNRG
jgi:transposase-like protein